MADLLSSSRRVQNSGPSTQIRCRIAARRREGELSTQGAAALGHRHTPALEPAPALHSGEQHQGGLAEKRAHHPVPAPGDVSVPVSLTEGVLARREPEVGAQDRGRPEAARVLHSSAAGQSRQQADPWHAHQPPGRPDPLLWLPASAGAAPRCGSRSPAATRPIQHGTSSPSPSGCFSADELLRISPKDPNPSPPAQPERLATRLPNLSSAGQISARAEAPPPGQSGGAALLVDWSAREGSPGVEEVDDGGMDSRRVSSLRATRSSTAPPTLEEALPAPTPEVLRDRDQRQFQLSS
jgi:hypothetical protein